MDTRGDMNTGWQINFDLYTLVKDILKEWYIILVLSLSAFLLSYTWQHVHYQPSYTISTTFIAGSRNAYTNIYSDLSNTSETAEKFTQIINSNILRKKVAEEINMAYMPGTVSATVVENTNLIELKVVEETPKLAYDVLNAVLNNYNKVSGSLLNNTVMTVLLKPEIPEQPDHPFSPWNGMCKAFLGTMLAMIVLIGGMSYFKDTVRREEDVEVKLETHLIGSLCHEKKYSNRKKKMKKSDNQKKSILFLDPMVSFRYTESMKKIASKISGAMKKRNAKTILVTSVLENEGKSTVAVNLALALREESERVLLIDGDLRKPAIYKIFQISPEEVENLGEALNGKSDLKHLIYTKKEYDLPMILNTIHYPDSTDMVSQDLMGEILTYLKQYYDYIIIDSSPMALVADTQELLGVTDAALLVVRQHMASARDINDAIAVLNHDEKKLLGCVFNDVAGENFDLRQGVYGKYGNYGYYGYYRGNYDKYGYGQMREKRGEHDDK